jgi:hypothetical protein
VRGWEVPTVIFSEGSTNLVEERGQTERRMYLFFILECACFVLLYNVPGLIYLRMYQFLFYI